VPERIRAIIDANFGGATDRDPTSHPVALITRRDSAEFGED